MDPLVATQAYNDCFCPFTRLPEELLLYILSFLRNDPVALYCLRQVSRIFLRLLNYRSGFWKDTWYGNTMFSRDITPPCHLHGAFRLPLQRLLKRDGRCDNCRRWNDAQKLLFYDDCRFQQKRRTGDPYDHRWLYRMLYCNACDSLHDICQFSLFSHDALRQERRLERRCLGQQGSVELCEHVQIAWASIKAHIDDWRQQHRDPGGVGRGDLQACIDSFLIECHDASHDIRCTSSSEAAPTWPRARLRTGGDFLEPEKNVLLSLEWTPHSGRIDDALPLTADGRIPASGLRALFRRLRQQGPADNLYPPVRPSKLPEMAYFSPSGPIAPLIHYETGNDDKPPLPPPPTTMEPSTTFTTTMTSTPPPPFPYFLRIRYFHGGGLVPIKSVDITISEQATRN